MSDTNGATLPVSPINDENPKHAIESHTIRADEPEHFEISLKHFDILGILGEGAFGKVKRIERKKKHHAQYALKYIDKKKCIEKHATTNIFRERMVLQSLHHQYIVNLKYAFQDDENLFMVLDLAEGGDLRCHLDRLKVMKDDTLLVYVAEISYALGYLHENRIIHRDLKPENLLLDKDGHILLTDFNVCANLKDSTPSSPSGTRPYMAPEMFIGKPYNYSVDWWAVGIIMYECTWGRRPYKVEKEWTVAHFESVPVTYPDMAFKTDIRVPPSPDRDEFIKGLLEIDRTKRLGSSNHYHGFEQDIKPHPWLKSIDWKLIEQKRLQPAYRPNVKALNIDSALLIDEIIGGGDGLAYKVRKADKKPSAMSKAIKGLKKMMGMKVKEPVVVDPNAPPPKLTPEDQQMADMDKYYTNFNWELPDQKSMEMPPKPKKEKKQKDGETSGSSSQPRLEQPDDNKDGESDIHNVKGESATKSIHHVPSDLDLLRMEPKIDEVKEGESANQLLVSNNDCENVVNDVAIKSGDNGVGENIVFNVSIPEARLSFLNGDVQPDTGVIENALGTGIKEEDEPSVEVSLSSPQTALLPPRYSAGASNGGDSNSADLVPRESAVSNEQRASRRRSRLSVGLVDRGKSIKEEDPSAALA